MKKLITQEPVRFVGAVQATLALAVLFGVDITAAQLAGIVLAVAAWLSFVTRQQVTPYVTPEGVYQAALLRGRTFDEAHEEAWPSQQGQSTGVVIVVVVLLLAILLVVTGHLNI